MILTLQAVSLNDQALTRPITARFDASGGTIGRADHSTMALPDPERFISRKQAEVVFVGDSYVIRNLGAANPITVAQRTLAAGETAVLRHGDEVRIGGYLLRAECRLDGAGRASPGGQVDATIASGAFPPLPPKPPARPPVPAPAQPPVQPKRPLAAATPARPAFAPPPPPLASDNPFADLFGPADAAAAPATAPAAASSMGAPSDDPFAGLLPPPAGVDPVLGGVAAPPAKPARLPDDFDPFAAPSAAAAPSPGGAPAMVSDPAGPFAPAPAPMGAMAASTPHRASDDPFADLLGDGAAGATPGSSIDQAFGLGSDGAGNDALARFLAEPASTPAAGGAAAPGLPTDPLMLFGESGSPADTARPAAAASERAAPALPDHVPALHGAYTPPRVPSPAAPPPAAAFIPATVVAPLSPANPPRAAPAPGPSPVPSPPRRPSPARPQPARAGAAIAPAAAAAGDATLLWRAFCEGAGVDLPPPPGDGAALMRHIGRIMRTAVDGTLQLMAVRASAKHEMRAVVTQIQASNNNPLKFAPDGAAGLEALVSPPQRGFIDGASAMDEAMLDLVGHSIGTVAGMRAAIEGMLKRFEPAALEDKLGAGSRLSNLLPMNRKARLWELYLQHHGQIRDEAEDDFHTLFGRAFVAAYEQQVERLERQRRQQRRPADTTGR